MKRNYYSRLGILLSPVLMLALMLIFACQDQSSRQEKSSVAEGHDDMGENPWVLDIEEATIANTNYRHAKWSGKYMQMVLMSLKPGEVIDLELHENHDQFIRIEQGEARVLMGKSRDQLTFDEKVQDDWAIFIPAGYWHEVRNTGDVDLKLYTIYAPPEHPVGTVRVRY